MWKLIQLIILIFIGSGCIKEKSTSHRATWTNGSTHLIEVRPFIDGVIYQDKIVILKSDSSKVIGKGWMRGINEVGSVNFAPKYYFYTSEENLLNIKSYEGIIVDDNKYRRTIHYNYTFTEQHFIDAK